MIPKASTKQIMVRAHLGFSMIDVLIAILVLATGLLALGVLQGALARNGADARARTQIAAYAETLIDKSRANGYDAFGSMTVTPSSSACSASPQSFTQKMQCEAYNAQTYAGVSNLTTTIASTENYGSSGGTWVTAKPAGYTDKTPHYKQVTVTTTWTDSVGQSRTQTYDTTVSPVTVNPGDNSLASTAFNLTGSTKPQVREANPANTLGVIPIAISSTSDAAATNPKPVVTNTGTTFSQYTYNSTTSQYGGNLITQRVDTKVIQCKCQYGGAATNDTNLLNAGIMTQPYRPTYWDGYRYTTPLATSSSTSSTGLDSSATTQDTSCDVCCRDRNDTAADTVKFDSFSNDFNHYKFVQASGTLVVSTDSYQQACRLIRVDGSYVAATDAHNYFFGLLSTDTCANQGSSSQRPTGCNLSSLDFSDTIPSSTTEGNYASFVKDYLNTNFSSLKSTGKSGEVVASPLTSSSTAAGKWNGGTFTGATAALNINPSTNSTNTTITLPNSVSRWLYARGLYVDFLESPARTALTNAISGCTDSDVNNCALPVLPFTTINMSELGNTSSTDTNVILVSNTAVISGDETYPSRGSVTVPTTQNGSTKPTANGVYKVYATNSSLTGVESIPNQTSQANSLYDSSNILTDQRQFTVVGAGGGGGGGSGAVYFYTDLSGLTYLANASSLTNYNSTAGGNGLTLGWNGSTSQLGTAASNPSVNGCPTTGTYQARFGTKSGNGCTITGPESVSYTASTSPLRPPVGITINVQGFNTSSKLSGVYGSETVSCTGGSGTNTYNATSSDKVLKCYNYAVDAANILINGANAGLTSANVSLLSGTTDGSMKEGAVITLPSTPGISGSTNTIAGATSVVIPFTLTGTTIASGTCACNNSQCNNPKYTPAPTCP